MMIGEAIRAALAAASVLGLLQSWIQCNAFVTTPQGEIYGFVGLPQPALCRRTAVLVVRKRFTLVQLEQYGSTAYAPIPTQQ